MLTAAGSELSPCRRFKVILYTNHKLVPAICLYKKFGFCEVDIGCNKYIESDMKMELKINGND